MWQFKFKKESISYIRKSGTKKGIKETYYKTFYRLVSFNYFPPNYQYLNLIIES